MSPLPEQGKTAGALWIPDSPGSVGGIGVMVDRSPFVRWHDGYEQNIEDIAYTLEGEQQPRERHATQDLIKRSGLPVQMPIARQDLRV